MEVKEPTGNGSSLHNVSDYFLFIPILSNPGKLKCLGENEESTDDVRSANM